MNDEDAYTLVKWSYDVKRYGQLTIEELTSGWYRCALLDGERAGFLCHGRPARSPYLDAQYAQHPDDVDIGLALRPDLVGKGLGLSLLEHMLDIIGRERSIRLALFASNAAAMQVYERAGFRLVCRVGDVLLMRREASTWREASRPLDNGMAVYPGDPAFTRDMLAVADVGGYNVTRITMTAHNGTHIDSPHHIGLTGGVDAWPLDRLNGPAQVVDLAKWRASFHNGTAAPATRRTLLKTGGIPLSEAEAHAWANAGVRTIGVDQLSVGPQGPEGLKTHRALLESGVCVLEGLALDGFEPGWYELQCLPILLPGCDGAPVRALLRTLERAEVG
ncbi:hypothetical protein AGMMS49992_01410 [Clostridia bacterium]|nr:hypothetical protein AGMMS49992_01410 [Clostridia bacterium]